MKPNFKTRPFDVKPYLIEIEEKLPSVTSELKRQAITGSRDFLLFSASELSKPHPAMVVLQMLVMHLENLVLCGIDPQGLAVGLPPAEEPRFTMVPVPYNSEEGGAQ